MKSLIFILVLAISAQPLQAGFCDMDMDKNQQSSHQMGQMDHSGQDKHDCCDPTDTDSEEGCNSEMKCGFCFATVPALPSLIKVGTAWDHPYSLDISPGLILPSHSSPLFRPPIS